MASTINITKSSPGNIIITGKWTWYDYYKVEYSWENAPDGVTLPETINKIKNGSIIAVDTTYNSSSEVDTNDYYYTFSGWNKSGNITVNADTVISGVWTQKNYLTVSYSWTDAPTSVTLPNSTTRLKSGDTVTVDSTYNSDSEVDTDTCYYTFSGWNQTGDIIVTSDTVISGVWTIHDYLKVSYSWTNAPSSVTLPKTVTKLKPGDNVTVDTTYNSSSEVDTNDYYYTFSGWNKSGNITVNADTTITGIWTQNKYLTVSYSWTDAPNGVTLPNSTTKLKPGDSVTVDTTYNSSSIKELDPSVKIGKISSSSSSTSRHWRSVCYGNGKFVTVSGGSNASNYFAYSTDGINWTEGTISSTARQWRSVCYGNGKFVAVANDTNYFAYSTDGITWTEGTISSANRDWWSVCYGNGKFVAVANNSTYFAYSTDGITWTEGTISSTRRYWRSVCYGNNKYVAVGSHIEASGGTYSYFAYSTDGIKWTEGTISSTARQWQGVCYGNDKFVAVAYSSNYSAYSTNGINWTESTISSDSTNLQSVCYGNGKFVAVGSNSYLYYSTDGIKWKLEIIHNAKIPWQEVCYGNNKFVAVDKDNNEYFAYFTDSTYYYQFSGWNQTGNITVTKDTVISGVWSQKNYLTVSYSWTDAPTNLMSTVPDSCGGFKPGDTYIVDSNYTSNTAKKDIDGWTEGTISGTSRDWMSVCYGNGKFVAVAENSNYFAYSTNGITWTEGTISGTSRDWMSVCYGNGKFVAVGYNLTSNSVLLSGNDFAYSTDGITWTESTISSTSSDTTRQWYSVCYGNSKFVLVAYNDNYFAYSTDGINWTESTISSTSRYWRSVCYGNSKFVAVASGSNYFAYSTDGINWTESTISSTSRQWWSVCYGNGKFVAVASSSNYFAYSTDGINWTESTISSTSRKWRSVRYGNGIFVAIAYNSNYFAYSTDGINWTESTISSTSRNWRSVCYGNNKLVAVAYGSNYFAYSSLYDIFYIFSGWNKTGNITLNDNTVITGKWSKKELITISSRHITEISSTGRDWQSVCYGNGKFVAVAENSNYFAYSTNGINWTEGTISSTSRKWLSVCYGNEKFVAVAYNSNYFAYSTDGINWTEGTISSTSRNWYSVCYGNGKFVAVASSSNYFAYSTDGINWTEGTISSTSRKWYSVCYGNDRFVTIGYHETNSYPSWSATAYAAYSTDGITWTENVYGPYSNDMYHRWKNICYGNNIFVVTGDGSTYYSTDGIIWNASGLGVAKSDGVCYNNGIFVSVGNDTSSGHKTQYVSYSTNGIRWNTTSSSPSDIIVWDSVCYGNGKFVAVGHMVNDEFNYDLVDGNNVMYFYCNLNYIN